MRYARSIGRWVSSLPLMLAASVLSGCGGGGPMIIDPVDTYTPNFTFVWDEVNASGAFVEPTHRFSLLTDQEGQQQGTFTDQSNEELGGQTNPVTAGTFKNHDLSLTVDRSGTTVAITGRFLTDDTIQFREPARTYTVKRNTNL